MSRFLSIGECMLELSGAGDDLWRMGIAGDTLNTAWYARACLPDSWQVAYGTCIGRDPFSARVPAFLQENGIEVDRIQTHPTRSVGLYAISLVEGERSFAYWRSASAARTLADDLEQLETMTREAQVIHVSGITLAILPPEGRRRLIEVMTRRRAEGVTVSLDPNIRPALWEDPDTAAEILTQAARAATILLPSFDDEKACFGDATPAATLARYAALGADTVIVKNGGGAILARHEGQSFETGELARVTPVDTTGAGDSFNGACLAAIATGSPLPDAVAAGHTVASKVVMHRGALMPMKEIA
ncbi:2-dehydro-3-deoxygluconokinase [Sagittula marina]|uniref:2-dehydro-3-deoxygluconokinase n=1 Tax=Sagittula marina TaxID=943940 RepID=A0A7W6DQH8_9RHOB|nr:sugar kinase [Sagittula marina]MBB3987278.1 2-dehydro-3-deoxygluconokinase [Sagittula marina]